MPVNTAARRLRMRRGRRMVKRLRGYATFPPLTRSLLGAGSGHADEEDYREYLWRKYGS